MVSSDLEAVLQAIGVILLVAAVVPFVAYGVPQVVGGDAAFVVLSSSMAPTIGPGDVVYVRDVPAEQIQPGDVITYRADTGVAAPRTITHRVVDVVRTGDGPEFVTRGDALEERDRGRVPPEAVVGRVMFVVPLVGHVILFARTDLGLLLLLVLPGTALFASELWALFRAAREDGLPGDASAGEDR